jgi:hypothetical protein
MSSTPSFGTVIGFVAVFVIICVAIFGGPAIIKTIQGFENNGSNNNGPAASMDMNSGPMMSSAPMPMTMPSMNNMNNNGNNNGNSGNSGNNSGNNNEGFANAEPSDANIGGPASMPFAAANKPTNCYPKIQLNPTELLPSDPNSKWEQVNPQGAGDIAGKNYLNAGALIGVNTVGQSLRNASYDLRSEPANPQVAVSPWFNSTIEPDTNRKTFEIA